MRGLLRRMEWALEKAREIMFASLMEWIGLNQLFRGSGDYFVCIVCDTVGPSNCPPYNDCLVQPPVSIVRKPLGMHTSRLQFRGTHGDGNRILKNRLPCLLTKHS